MGGQERMVITLDRFNDTPVFILRTEQKAGWDRVWGASRRDDGWAFPAYYPFGHWAGRDIHVIDPRMQWDDAATRQWLQLEQTDRQMARLDAAYERKESIEIPIPSGFQFKLPPYKHQQYGISRALLRWRDYMLWEMGTGKTKVMVELFRILKATGRLKRVLVVAPPVVLPTWKREILQHSDGELSPFLWVPSEKVPREELYERAQQHDVVIVSYAGARVEAVQAQEAKRESRLLQLDYNVIVGDESQNLGGAVSAQTKAVLRLSTKATYRYELTGTPGDRPDQLYAQLRFLAPGLMPMDYEKFCTRYLRYHRDKPYLIVGFKHLDVINDVVNSVSTWAKKSECLDLPPMTIQDVLVAARPNQIARYNEIAAEMKASLNIDFRYLLDPSLWDDEQAKHTAMLNLPHAAARVLKLLQVASGFLIVGPDSKICDNCGWQEMCVRAGVKPYTQSCQVIKEAPPKQIIRDFDNPKLETFEYYIKQILEADPTNKVICWGSFHPELDDMESLVLRNGWGYVRVDGSNTKHIKKYEDEFQGNPACRVYIGQVASGVGITLTAANYMVYYSLPWNRQHYRQSLERSNRPGQFRPITVYRLMVQETLDEFIATLLSYKDLVAYTLTEKITCAPCERQLSCAQNVIRPFREGCIYESAPDRPIAAATLIRNREE